MTNYHSIYSKRLNNEFIDLVSDLYQIENYIKTNIAQQNNTDHRSQTECQSIKKIVKKSLVK